MPSSFSYVSLKGTARRALPLRNEGLLSQADGGATPYGTIVLPMSYLKSSCGTSHDQTFLEHPAGMYALTSYWFCAISVGHFSVRMDSERASLQGVRMAAR